MADGQAAVLAIDGGNSKTDVALIGWDGSVLAARRGPGASHEAHGVDGAMRRLGEQIKAVADKAHLGAAFTWLWAIVRWPLAFVAVLVLFAARDLWFRRTLELADDGFHYVAGLRREYATWVAVVDVRVRQERHWLSLGRTLEIDLSDDTLIVLSGAQLGADPDDVAAIVEARWNEALRSAKPS